MRKLLLLIVVFTYSVFSSSFIHAYMMGSFSDGESHEMVQHAACCPGEEQGETHNPGDDSCKSFFEYTINAGQKIIQISQSEIAKFIPDFIFLTFGDHFDRVVFNIPPPPIIHREIKNYAYSDLTGEVKNVN